MGVRRLVESAGHPVIVPGRSSRSQIGEFSPTRCTGAVNERLGVDPDVVARVVRFLVVRGVFALDGTGVVRPTRVCRALCDRQSGSYAARLDWLGAAGRLTSGRSVLVFTT
ncbi:hypothetical protein [Flindersiella endophytica]